MRTLYKSERWAIKRCPKYWKVVRVPEGFQLQMMTIEECERVRVLYGMDEILKYYYVPKIKELLESKNIWMKKF